jgi:hypothetical protein
MPETIDLNSAFDAMWIANRDLRHFADVAVSFFDGRIIGDENRIRQDESNAKDEYIKSRKEFETALDGFASSHNISEKDALLLKCSLLKVANNLL